MIEGGQHEPICQRFVEHLPRELCFSIPYISLEVLALWYDVSTICYNVDGGQYKIPPNEGKKLSFPSRGVPEKFKTPPPPSPLCKIKYCG